MSLQYMKSKKGRDQLLYKGYLHTKERVFGNKTVWKCANYHKDRCPGRAHTCDDRVIKYSAHHHPPGKAAREAKRTERSAKTTTPSSSQLTYNTTTPSSSQLTHRVVLPTSSGLPEIVPTRRPRIPNVKQAIQRLRACMSAARQGTSPSQTSSTTVTKSVPEGPPSVPSAVPPDLHECSEKFKDGSLVASPMLCEEPEASHLVHLRASQEAGRQRFRSGTVPPGTNPREILTWLSEAAQQWLCPQEHNKDQIVDMLILEQFLAVLPLSMQAWVKARDPRSSMEAAELAETYLGDKELATAHQELEKDLVTFGDVSLHFSEEEWGLLDQAKKALYWNVMHQNYDNVAWLSGGTASKREEDPWQEAPGPIMELRKKSNKEISWGDEQELIRESHPERQPQSSSAEKEDGSLFIRDAELGLETLCVCCDCRKREGSSSLVASRKSHREEEAEPVMLSGELKEPSEMNISQNLEENLTEEGQKDVERQQSDNARVEEYLIPFGQALRDHQASRPGQETPRVAVEGGDRGAFLTLLHDQIITIEDDLECVALPVGSLLILEEEISQSPEEDSQPEPIPVYSHNDLKTTYSQESVDGTAALISQESIVRDRERISSPGKEGGGGEVNSTLAGAGLPELTQDLLLSHSQPAPEPQPMGLRAEESSENNSHQKSSQGEDLSEGLCDQRRLIQNSASATQPTCSDSGANFSSLSVLMKGKRSDKKRRPCGGRNVPVRSALGTRRRIYAGGKLRKHLNLKNWWASRKLGCGFPDLQMGLRKHRTLNSNAQPHETLQTAKEAHRTTSQAASSSDTREAEPWQGAPSPSLRDKMAAEPIVVQLMAVLEQVAADTAEIKSAVSRLYPTMAGIQHALGNLSGCSSDAEHRILDLEYTSQNTKAQLMQHCNDIKAIEAKLVGKAVQTNVIAGLWPALGIKREMCP